MEAVTTLTITLRGSSGPHTLEIHAAAGHSPQQILIVAQEVLEDEMLALGACPVHNRSSKLRAAAQVAILGEEMLPRNTHLIERGE